MKILNPPRQMPNAQFPKLDVFITCNSIELERLPWEAWNIGNEFAATSDIRSCS